MFQGIKNGAGLIMEAIRALGKYPRMLIPLLLCWIIYAPLLVIFRFHIPWENFEFSVQVLIVFSAILLLSIIFSWSAFMLLELIRQIETDENRSLFKAIEKSISNTIIALPVAVSWAVIWFVLSIIEAILSKGSEDSNEEFNAENVARTLAGNEEFSLSGACLNALKKGVRMVAFLIYPAIAWENLRVGDSVKKGLGVVKLHKSEFFVGFALTELAATVIFLPPAVLFFISSSLEVIFSDMVWFGVILYCAFASSFMLFLEQMFVAELYLWNLIWEKELDQAMAEGTRLPRLEDVKRPSIMDGVADLQLTKVEYGVHSKVIFDIDPEDINLKKHIETYANGGYGTGKNALHILFKVFSRRNYKTSVVDGHIFRIEGLSNNSTDGYTRIVKSCV